MQEINKKLLDDVIKRQLDLIQTNRRTKNHAKKYMNTYLNNMKCLGMINDEELLFYNVTISKKLMNL